MSKLIKTLGNRVEALKQRNKRMADSNIELRVENELLKAKIKRLQMQIGREMD